MPNGTDANMAELAEVCEEIKCLEGKLEGLPERSRKAARIRENLNALYVRRNILEGRPTKEGLRVEVKPVPAM